MIYSLYTGTLEALSDVNQIETQTLQIRGNAEQVRAFKVVTGPNVSTNVGLLVVGNGVRRVYEPKTVTTPSEIVGGTS